MQRHGLVLGAGGSLAWVYHLGVIEGLRDAGLVDPTYASRIVGTSAGAVVGAALIAGTSTDDFLAALAGAGTSGFMAEIRAARAKERHMPAAAIQRHALGPLAGSGRRLPAARLLGLINAGAIPTSGMIDLPAGYENHWDPRLWVPAVRVRDGATVVFGRDCANLTIREGIEATCAVPLLFQPKAIGGERYVDGAVTSGTHADVLAADKHEFVIVSAPMSRSGRGWVKARARRHLHAELASLHRAGCQTIVFIPDDAVIAAAEGYPRRRRDARSSIVEAARRQTLRIVAQHTARRSPRAL